MNPQDRVYVLIAKRRNPLAWVMLIVFAVLAVSAFANGSIAAGVFLSVSALAFLGVREDAQR